MYRLTFAACVVLAVLTAVALDNTVHNSFWDTRNYVNPSPSVAMSSGSATATFDLSGHSVRVAERLPDTFRSTKPRACAIYLH